MIVLGIMGLAWLSMIANALYTRGKEKIFYWFLVGLITICLVNRTFELLVE